jgi:V/A-type H+/Na+-transporting ATPase subunit F
MDMMSSSENELEPKDLIAVIGERELVIGYRLLGINDTFLVGKDSNEAIKTMDMLFSSHKFAMIIASSFIRDSLPPLFKLKVESSLRPLVLFMPSLNGNMNEESLSSLAKRVLGINI